MLERIKNFLKDPAFCDIFGLITFSFISIVAIRSLSVQQPFSAPLHVIFLIIGVSGLLIDSQMVWRRFFKKEEKEK